MAGKVIEVIMPYCLMPLILYVLMALVGNFAMWTTEFWSITAWLPLFRGMLAIASLAWAAFIFLNSLPRPRLISDIVPPGHELHRDGFITKIQKGEQP